MVSITVKTQVADMLILFDLNFNWKLIKFDWFLLVCDVIATI